jgi:surface polysaccharide O-acyltransferase-like enzyme
MMTGVLLFPVKGTLGQFYGKRLGRLLVPLVFWSLALPLMYYVYFQLAGPSASPSVDMSTFTGGMTLQKMYTFIFNFNYDTTPLWYLYMLVGVYLIIPIFSAWLQQASQKEIKLFLGVWAITLFLPYIKMLAPILGYSGNYGHMGLYGECDWNIYGSFYYVSGFVGYLILAYYLKKYPLDWSWKKIAIVCMPMFAVGYAITSVGYVITNEYFPGNYAYLAILWYFAGINVFMMTFPVFIVIQKCNFRSRKWLSKAAQLTFGVYLCHFTFTFLSYDLYNHTCLPYIVRILLATVTTATISALLTWALSKCRWTHIFVR